MYNNHDGLKPEYKHFTSEGVVKKGIRKYIVRPTVQSKVQPFRDFSSVIADVPKLFDKVDGIL